MSHVFEQYFHSSENAPVQELFGESILKTTIDVAPKLIEELESYEYREVVMLNATLALNKILTMGVKTDWASHMIEHGVSAVHDIPHGGGMAIIFPHWMEYVSETKPEKIAQLGVNVFGLNPDEIGTKQLAKETAKRVRSFWNSLGAPSRLSDYEIDDKEIDLIIERSFISGETVGNYVPLNKEDVRYILQRAL